MFLICSQSRLPDAVSGAVHSMPALDTQWIESTSKKMALRLEKLDMDLKNYKSNSIKESIRLCLSPCCFVMSEVSNSNHVVIERRCNLQCKWEDVYMTFGDLNCELKRKKAFC